jgi:hypothetical protein
MQYSNDRRPAVAVLTEQAMNRARWGADDRSSAMIFYLRIPKTGSETLSSRMASAFLPEETYVLSLELRTWDKDLLTQLQTSKRFVDAHVARGGGALGGIRDCDFLCTVREPVEQLVSLYRHIRREPASVLHRAAERLSAGTFFDNFADMFTNYQTAYLVLAFEALETRMQLVGPLRTLTAALPRAVDRLRWLVPTEKIDAFVSLWPIESGIVVPNRQELRNVASDDDGVGDEARAAIVARPHLTSLDGALWALACEHFAAWRDGVLEKATPWSFPNDSRVAYRDGDSGIWLRDNWRDPLVSNNVRQWWAGPGQVSRVAYRRRDNQRFLHFDVAVVSGLSRVDIQALNHKTLEPLPLQYEPRGPDCVRIYAPLDSTCPVGEMLIAVPLVMAGILSTRGDESLTRQSFVSQEWGLSEAGPGARAVSREAIGPGAQWRIF